MIGKVSLLLVLSLSGLSYGSQFCDIFSVDSVFNIGHLIYFLRCGQMWTFDHRMNGYQGGFLRDWSFNLIAQKRLWRDNEKERDFRFSGFSFQELDCFNYGDDLSDSCYKSVRQWQHLTVLFSNFTYIAFKYTTELEELQEYQNPLKLKPKADLTKSKEFWPSFEGLNPHSDIKENYLSVLYDPEHQKLYLALKYSQINLITWTDMNEPIHNISAAPLNTGETKWAPPFVFEGHLVGMFYDPRIRSSYVVGEVLRETRKFNDQIYPLSVASETSQVVVGISPNGEDGQPLNLRTYFGCRYTQEEKKERRQRREDQDSQGGQESQGRNKRCAFLDKEDDLENLENQMEPIPETPQIDFLTRMATEPKVMISLSILIVISSSVLLFLYLDFNPIP